MKKRIISYLALAMLMSTSTYAIESAATTKAEVTTNIGEEKVVEPQLAGVAQSAQTQVVAQTTEEGYIAYAVPGLAKIDGIVSENEWIGTQIIDFSETIRKGTVQDPYKMTYQTMYDDKNLYVLMNVETSSELSTAGKAIWNRDSLEIFVDLNNDKSEAYDANDQKIAVDVNGEVSYKMADNFKIEYKVVKSEKGFMGEFKIPLTENHGPGSIIGFDVQAGLSYGTKNRAVLAGWAGEQTLSATTPSAFGILKLHESNLPTILPLLPEVDVKEQGANIPVTLPLLPEVDVKEQGANIPVTLPLLPEVDVKEQGANIPVTLPLLPEVDAKEQGADIPVNLPLFPAEPTIIEIPKIDGYGAYALPGTAVLDGNIDDWKGIEIVKLEAIRKGDKPASASFQTMYDDKYLYVLVKADVDSELNASGKKVWNRDCIELFIDQDNEKSTEYKADDQQIIIDFQGDVFYKQDNYKPEYKVVKTEDGFLAEFRIPLTLEQKVADVLGFDIQVGTTDNTSARTDLIGWAGEEIGSNKSPAMMGSLVLDKARVIKY